ncbi:MAG: hypothetical protein HQL20_07650 [Candidatus Omnitrophica bacterium]|nr:hypothetical protein [Candidatus Omnitrophota bacterium]
MRRFVAMVVIICLLATLPAGRAYSQLAPSVVSPVNMGHLSGSFLPPVIRGVTVDQRDPYSLRFLMEPGEARLEPTKLAAEYNKLIKYFLASLAIPEQDLWVNLSPFEKTRIIAENFGSTEMGRDLLSQDFVLKQVTSALLSPDGLVGKDFWQKVYSTLFERYGTTDVPVDTFNKVWIVPDRARVFEHGTSVVLVDVHLKVMLEADLLAEQQGASGLLKNEISSTEPTGALSREAVRSVVLPVLEKEVNEGRNFAVLRQITSALVLAAWYKSAWKTRLLNKVYSDRSLVNGVDQDPANNQLVFKRYLEAFQKGVFNSVREEVEPFTNEPIARKYFSGGYTTSLRSADGSMSSLVQRIVSVASLPAELARTALDLVRTRLNASGPVKVRNSRFTSAGVTAFLLGLYIALNPVQSEALSTSGVNLINQDARVVGRPVLKDKEITAAYDAMLRNYLHNKGALNKELMPEFSALLSGKDLTSLTVDELSSLARARMAVLKNQKDKEKIAKFRNESLSLAQLMARDWVVYNINSKAVIDLMKRQGWNCISIAYHAMILADEFRLDNVSVVSVVSTSDGKKYPDPKGLGHATVLSYDSEGSAWIHELGRAPTNAGYTVQVFDSYGKLVTVRVEDLKGTRWHGLTFARSQALLAAELEFNDIYNQMARWGVIHTLQDGSKDAILRMDDSNFLSVSAEFPGFLKRLDKIMEAVAWSPVLKGNVIALQTVLAKYLQTAGKVQSGDMLFKEILEFMAPWCSYKVDKANVLSWSIKPDNSPDFPRRLTEAMEKFRGLSANKDIDQSTIRMASDARDIIDNILQQVRKEDQNKQVIGDVFSRPRSPDNQHSWYTVENGVYKFAIASDEQRKSFIEESPDVIHKLKGLLEDTRYKSLHSFISQVIESILNIDKKLRLDQERRVTRKESGSQSVFSGQFKAVVQGIYKGQAVTPELIKQLQIQYEKERQGGSYTYEITVNGKKHVVNSELDVQEALNAIQKQFNDKAAATGTSARSSQVGGILLDTRRFVLEVQGKSAPIIFDPASARDGTLPPGLLPEILSIERTAEYLQPWTAVPNRR